jgi:uncharacterized protein involved in exopolysaccharide biosynthesis
MVVSMMHSTTQPPQLPTRQRVVSGDVVHSPPPTTAVHDHDGEALFNIAFARDLLAYAIGAVRRRRRIVLVTFAGTLAMAMIALLFLPRTYEASVKLLAERNLVLPVLSNPRRNLPKEEDTPTRLANEAILNRRNLIAIVNAAGLAQQWSLSRPLAGRMKDQITTLLFGPPKPEQITDALVGMLSRRLWVSTTDGTVTIGVTWPDPNMTYRIVQSAQENFFEDRHAEELALISESISILEQHASDVNQDIRSSLDSMSRVRASLPGVDARPFVASIRRSAPSAAVMTAQSRLEAVRRTILDLEQFRSRRLAELQATLADQRNAFGSAHPAIENTQQMIRALGTDSPQLVQLRREEQELRENLAQMGVDASGPSAASSTDPVMAMAALRGLERLQRDSVLNERLQYARSRLKMAVSSYEDLLSRIDAARIELETARAAFKYKYAVISPAELPRTAVSPRPLRVLVGGFALAVFLAVFVAVGLDVAAGRVQERWQMSRSIGLPVLAEVPPA